MQVFGRYFIIAGIVLILLGAVFLASGKIPWLGRLPGDFLIRRGNSTFYFPLASGMLVSVILSFLFYFISRK